MRNTVKGMLEEAMKIIIMLLTVVSMMPVAAFAAEELSFTSKDMWALSRKLSDGLRRCKPLRQKPEVVVDVQNGTTEFVDKTQFSELIHSMLERKTHAKPELKVPDFEIQARLTSSLRRSKIGAKATYTLSAEVLQAGEKLCAKNVKISKFSKDQNAKD